MNLTRVLWPLVTILVVIIAAVVYFVYPPVCSGPQPEVPVAPNASSHQPVPSTTESSPSDRPAWEADYRLHAFVRPTAYRVRLHPDLGTGLFGGSVAARIIVSAPAEFIVLHVNGLDVSQTTLYSDDGAVVPIQRAFAYQPNQFWVVVPASVPLPPGVYSLYLQFSGNMMRSIVGLYKSSYIDPDGENRNIATTKFEPTYARQAFPCFDEPEFKATYNVSLVRPSAGNYIALSNMNQLGEVADQPSKGLTTVSFATSVPMSTYLACFIVCDFESLPTLKSKHGHSINVYARSGQIQKMEYAQRLASAVIDYYVDYFGIDYPLPKLDLIAIPDFVSGAMENWGLITFRETSVLYDPEFSSVSNHLGVTTTVSHELAHMWFGDLVTMKWWDDLWLNEGFASFMAYKSAASYHPDWDLDTEFLSSYMDDALSLDATLSSHPIIKHVSHPDQITEIFDRISYSKGASVIRMLEGFMGEENFRKGVSSYLKDFEYKNADTNDLWNHLQKFASGVNIQRAMDTWTRQMGFPVLSVVRNGDTITVTQERFLANKETAYDPNESPYKYKWDVPVTYITSESDKPTLKWLLTDNSSLNINIGNAQWYKLNKQFMGYYRVNYPPEQWLALTQLLKNNNQAMAPSDRANLMDDVFNLAGSGILPYSTALNVTSFLSGEDNFVVWGMASAHLLGIDTRLRLTPAYSDYRKYLRKLITPHINDALWNFTQDASFLDRSRQVKMISLGCRVGVSACLGKAQQLFKNWLQNPTVKPHVEVRTIVYFYGMAESGEEEWDRLWELYLEETDPQEKAKLRYALCAVKEPWILARLIERAKNEDYVRSQDYFSVLFYIASNSVGNSLVWDWVRSNWQYLVDRFTLNNRSFGRLLPSVVSTYSTAVKLQEVKLFLEQNPEEGAGGAGRKSAVEAINLNIKWLDKHLEPLTAWLKTA